MTTVTRTALDRRALASLPRVDSPFFDADDPALGAHAELAKRYHVNGYAVIPDLLTASESQAVIDETRPLFDPRVEEGSQSRYRYQDAWSVSPAVRALAGHPRVLEILAVLYGRRPFPFQTLNFKTGTQQRNHSDSIHFSCLPARFMCGVWVALEDIDAENGPLFYYPRSHKLEEYTYYDMGMTAADSNPYDWEASLPAYRRYEDFIEATMEAEEMIRQEAYIPRGSAFIWASNLVHGGAPIVDLSRTRYSQVTHYFFADCIYYTPMHSDMAAGELFLREPIDVATGRRMPHSYNGQPVNAVATDQGRSRIHIGPKPSPARRLKSSAPGRLARRVLRRPYRRLRALGR